MHPNPILSHRFKTGHAERGLTLLEVMITLLVLAVGLLGIAGLLGVAVRQSQISAVHTTATLVGESMINRMSANLIGVWGDDMGSRYNGDYDPASPPSSPPVCDSANPCTPAQVAQADRAIWVSELAQFMPNSTANIQCTRIGGLPADSVLANRPPYSGYCDLTITWAPGAVETEGNSPQEVSVAWRFTP